tara:strand:- start:178 stop:567 length:390 start_codon:yes stop_codon:yes gene_type:complete
MSDIEITSELSDEYQNILLKYQYDLNNDYNEVSNENSIKYYDNTNYNKNVFNYQILIYILLLIFQIIIIVVIIFKVLSNLSDDDNNPIIYLILFFILLPIILSVGYQFKFAIEKKNNITFPNILTKLPS